jgi:hypothetical protein
VKPSLKTLRTTGIEHVSQPNLTAANDHRGPEAIACRRMADPPLTIPRIGKGQRIRRAYMLRLRVGKPMC